MPFSSSPNTDKATLKHSFIEKIHLTDFCLRKQILSSFSTIDLTKRKKHNSSFEYISDINFSNITILTS